MCPLFTPPPTKPKAGRLFPQRALTLLSSSFEHATETTPPSLPQEAPSIPPLRPAIQRPCISHKTRPPMPSVAFQPTIINKFHGPTARCRTIYLYVTPVFFTAALVRTDRLYSKHSLPSSRISCGEFTTRTADNREKVSAARPPASRHSRPTFLRDTTPSIVVEVHYGASIFQWYPFVNFRG